jgi:ubiquinone/menaquinone biosynthesis C-methylase UbiE
LENLCPINEIESYDQILPGGADTSTPHNLQKRLKLIVGFTESSPSARILDCGCGAGEYVINLQERGLNAWGIEYNGVKVKKYHEGKGYFLDRIIVGDAQEIPFSEQIFDYVLVNEVLEHIPDDGRALNEIYRILKPGGLLLLFSPNRFYPFETHGVILKGANKRLPFYLPFIPYIPLEIGNLFFRYWARNYWPGELRLLVEQSSFKIIHSAFVWQTFENISGVQPLMVKIVKPALRRIFSFLENVPFICSFGVSQFVVAKKS